MIFDMITNNKIIWLKTVGKPFVSSTKKWACSNPICPYILNYISRITSSIESICWGLIPQSLQYRYSLPANSNTTLLRAFQLSSNFSSVISEFVFSPRRSLCFRRFICGFTLRSIYKFTFSSVSNLSQFLVFQNGSEFSQPVQDEKSEEMGYG